jgi:hypothetical protein
LLNPLQRGLSRIISYVNQNLSRIISYVNQNLCQSSSILLKPPQFSWFQYALREILTCIGINPSQFSSIRVGLEITKQDLSRPISDWSVFFSNSSWSVFSFLSLFRFLSPTCTICSTSLSSHVYIPTGLAKVSQI